MGDSSTVEVRVLSMRHEAEDVVSVDFAPYGAPRLPAFSAGSHIDVHLPNGLSRSYSLVNPQGETHRYAIGVHRDAKSRGGSQFVHSQLRVGQLLRVSVPRNTFPLNESAGSSVFFAGGIGVTPFLSMLDRLNRVGAPWRLYYCVRSRARAAFIERLEQLAGANTGDLVLNFDEEPGGHMLDLAESLSKEPPDAHVYCCGPSGMLRGFKEACRDRPDDRVHLEYFSSTVAPAVTGGFSVRLQRTGKTVFVPKGNTILEVLLAEGLDIPYSCQQGICAACETTVLSGVPEHRDMILTPEQQASNKVMMICCSGSKSDELVLDR